MIKKLFYSLSLFFIVLQPSLYGELIPFLESHHYLEGFHLFEGDQHSQFKGDVVALLSDGSEWKGHPTQSNILSQWQPGEEIHAGVRTSWYWFKREHKFYLYNHDRKELVKAMMTYIGDHPKEIILASESFPTTKTLVNVYDNNGRFLYSYWEYGDYRADIVLSNGEAWRISSSFSHFKEGQPVYLGYNMRKSLQPQFFLISGYEREAKWTWAEKLGNE